MINSVDFISEKVKECVAEIRSRGREGVGPRLDEVVHCGEEGSGVMTGVGEYEGEVGKFGSNEGIFVGNEVEFIGFMVDCER